MDQRAIERSIGRTLINAVVLFIRLFNVQNASIVGVLNPPALFADRLTLV